MRIRVVVSVEIDAQSWCTDRGILGQQRGNRTWQRDVRDDVRDELIGQCRVFLETTGLGEVIEES